MTKTEKPMKKTAASRIKEVKENTGFIIRTTRSAHSSDMKAVEQMFKEICSRSPSALDDIATLEKQMNYILQNPPKPSKQSRLVKRVEEAMKWVRKDADTALAEFRALRDAFSRNDINNAVRHALRGMQSAMTAAVGLVEPMAQMGRAQTEHGRKGGLTRKTPTATSDKWKQEADFYRSKHKDASKNCVADHVSKKCGGSIWTIRRYI